MTSDSRMSGSTNARSTRTVWTVVVAGVAAAAAIGADIEARRAEIFQIQQALAVPGLAGGDSAGFAVAFSEDGRTAVVGVPGRDVTFGGFISFQDSGAAYVFERSGQSWQLKASLTSGGTFNLPGSGLGGAEAGRRFGHAVAISGNMAVVTAPFEDVGDTVDAGAAYVFRKDGDTWTRVQTLTNPSPPFLQQTAFGDAVALDLSSSLPLMAVAARGLPGQQPGARYIFELPGLQWSFRSGSTMERVVSSLAVQGDTVAAGQPGGVNTSLPGHIELSTRNGISFDLSRLEPPDGAPGDLFGTAVAIEGDTLLAGAPGARSGRGAGYVFQRVGTSWIFQNRIDADNAPGASMGTSAAITTALPAGRIAVLGAPRSTGSAYVFRRGSSGWTHEQTLNVENGATSVALGVDASSGLTQLLLGAASASGGGTALALTETPSAPPTTPPTTNNLLPPVLGAPAVTGSTVQLTWSPAANATSYRVRAGTTPGASNAFDGNVGPMTSITATGVPNGSYFVRVHSVGSAGESGPSTELRVDVGAVNGCSPPSAPTQLAATVNGGVVSLSWNGAAGASAYRLEAGSSPGLANLAIIDVAGITFTASAPPGRYFVRARGINACGPGAASNEIVVDVP